MVEEILNNKINNLLILKLGGSVITKKAENKFEINKEILEKIANDIKKVKNENNFNLIIVCGVGPFGHTNVQNFNLDKGIFSEEQLEGVKKTNVDCNFVGEEVLKSLQKVGLKSKLIQVSKISLQENKKVYSFSVKNYTKLIDEQIIPVSVGTMVPDTELVWSVMSGDQIIAQLTKKMFPKKILLGTDVEGVFNDDPKSNEKAELIKNINKENVKEILQNCSGSKAVDVTGGMKGKLEKLVQNINNTPIEIFSLFVEGNLEKVLSGKEIKSTKIIL